MARRLQHGVHVYKRIYEEMFRATNKNYESIVLLKDITRGVAVLNHYTLFCAYDLPIPAVFGYLGYQGIYILRRHNNSMFSPRNGKANLHRPQRIRGGSVYFQFCIPTPWP